MRKLISLLALIFATSCGDPGEVSTLPLATTMSAASATDAPSNFRRSDFVCGVAVSYPAHWAVLSRNDDLNIQAAREAYGLGADPGRETLLLLNSQPSPHGAQFRMKLTNDPALSRDLLVSVARRSEVLGLWSDELRQGFQGGPVRVVQMRPAVVERLLSNHVVLHFSYDRESLDGGSDWQVDQYKIPLKTRLLSVTVSHRKSESALYSPILQSILASLTIADPC